MKHEPLNGARSLRVVPKAEPKNDSTACPPCHGNCNQGRECLAGKADDPRPAIQRGDGWRVLALLLLPFAGIAIGAAGVWLWRAWA